MAEENVPMTDKVFAALQFQIQDVFPGNRGCVVLPENPQEWVESLRESVKNNGYIILHIDTLAAGCGGCGFAFTSLKSPFRGFDELNN